MTEKPILFNAEMVNAILDERKTQTRRPVKENLCPFCDESARVNGHVALEMLDYDIPSPYGDVGDTLWVRETWNEYNGHLAYRADMPMHWDAGDTQHDEDVDITEDDYKWSPSIHMPRDYARIFLKIKSVRVERVQDISNDDAMAEGINQDNVNELCNMCSGVTGEQAEFSRVWESIYAKRGYGWDTNCWVWVYDFERVK